MDTLLELDGWIVLWLNRGIGHSAVLDGAAYLAVSDYFVPLSMCFWMLGLWSVSYTHLTLPTKA